MPTSYSPLKINGVISTDKTVLQNLNDICTACGAFLTFDVGQVKWAVVINTTGSSVKSYNDSNIIGNITVTESGVSELYNSVSLEFPHKNLRDQTDFIELSIPSGSRYPNEIDNALQIQSNLINDPVQAQYIAGVELNQSRLNKIITFTTDYTSLGLKAGDLIDVTSTMYGYTGKLFRITKLEEVDEDVIGINITAREYDPNVYSISNLVYKEKTKKTGILLKQQNETIKASDDADVSGSLVRMIAANIGLGLANSFLNKLFGRVLKGTDANGNPIFGKKTTEATDQEQQDLYKLLEAMKRPDLTSISAPAYVCEGNSITITVGHTCQVCLFNMPDFEYPYTITGVTTDDISIPLTGTVTVSGSTGQGTITFNTISDPDSENISTGETLVFTIGGQTANVIIYENPDYTIAVSSSAPSITEGGNFTVNVTSTGSKVNGSVPYTISGSASGKVTTSLTGNITLSGGSGSLTVNTTDDAVYTGTQGLTVSVGESPNPCFTNTSGSVSVTVLDNETPPPPDPPGPPADTTCEYVSVPAVWCGIFDGTDFQLKGISIRSSVLLPKPLAGEATITVPKTLSVSKGNPSTITVTATETVAASALNVGGHPVRIITSFDSVSPKGLITGTTVTLYGY